MGEGAEGTEAEGKMDDGRSIRSIVYDMGEFMIACCAAYRKAAREPSMVLKPVGTPFIDISVGEQEPPGKLHRTAF